MKKNVFGVRVMVLNAPFNNISVTSISWRSVLLVEYPEKTIDLLQLTLSHNVVSSTPRHGSNN
jgi:hypothetical protein